EADAARALERTVRSLARRERTTVALRPGAKVLELVPRGSPDKGDAIARWFEEARPGSVVYFGDSAGDEPAFRAVRERGGLAVRVGDRRRRTAADERLGGPEELGDLLATLARFVGAPRPR